jgi:hypothetical protein
VPVVFILSAFGPGLLLVRRLDWSAEEKIAASITLSLLILYLACFGVFVLDLPRVAHLAILLACAGLTVAAAPATRRILASREALGLLGGIGLLALWVLALLCLVRNYSGGPWYGDWFEHYQRARFFLGGHEAAETFQGYALPARPPLVNVLGAHLLALAGDLFRVYQLASSLMGLLAYVPICLLARLASRSGRVAYGVVAAFLMFNPMFVQNATYSWSKLPAAFFVLCGTYFYVTGWRRRDYKRMLVAAAALAGGVLAHYSSCTYALFFAGHYLLFVLPARPARWKEAAAIAACVAVLLGSWLGWSVVTYGARQTLSASSTVRDRSGRTVADDLRMVAGNLRDTLVPHGVKREGPGRIEPGVVWGALRDTAFTNYQQTLPFGLGLLGAGLLLYEIIRTRRGAGGHGDPGGGDRGRPGPAEDGPVGDPTGPVFWACFAVFNLLAGVTAHAAEARLGLAHVVLQPLVFLGVAFLAARFPDWPRPARWTAIAGLLIDALLGVLLHFWFQSIPLGDAGGAAGLPGLTAADLRIGGAVGNWTLQLAQAAVFVGSDLRAWSWLPKLLAAGSLAAGFWVLARRVMPPAQASPGTGRP